MNNKLVLFGGENLPYTSASLYFLKSLAFEGQLRDIWMIYPTWDTHCTYCLL